MSKLIVTFSIKNSGIAEAVREAVADGDYKAVAQCVAMYDADKMEVVDE